MGNRHSPVADWPDRLLAAVARTLIRCYQRLLAKRLGRTCLFQPSCSQRALEFFREENVGTALRRVRRQLQDCRGNYSVRLNGTGWVELITASGRIVPESEINPQLLARLRDLHEFGRGI